ncbi:MAG: hypothetical protein JWQ99_1966 [Blastococcus sp.]|jgi:hypothetical protein|nr:hypothetical protein [Blastococcus sp.]
MSEPPETDDGSQPHTTTGVPPVPGPPPGLEGEEDRDEPWANPAVMDPG